MSLEWLPHENLLKKTTFLRLVALVGTDRKGKIIRASDPGVASVSGCTRTVGDYLVSRL